MARIPLTPETKKAASRIIWFEEPQQALKDPIRFMAYAMRYATHEDMRILRKYVSDRDFVTMLDNIPPGIVDKRSWAYWNAVFNRYPAPPLPARKYAKTCTGENVH